MQPYYPTTIREEDLKNRVAADFFGSYDCTRIVGNIDFCASTKARDSRQLTLLPEETLFWAEAKNHPTDLHRVLETTVRNIFSFEVKKVGPRITFIVRGDGFLYKQVSRMVGFLIRVGLGEERPCAVTELLDGHTSRAQPAFPQLQAAASSSGRYFIDSGCALLWCDAYLILKRKMKERIQV